LNQKLLLQQLDKNIKDLVFIKKYDLIIIPIKEKCFEFFCLILKMCAIAIMRSGDAMIKPVRSVIKDIETGSILIKEKKDEGPKVFVTLLIVI
jgi:uracil phosphoribosyltransferase